MLKICQHKIDDPAEFVLADDPAWDQELINKELDEMTERGESHANHPYSQYRNGETRYCLRLVRKYLKKDEEPTIFKIIKPLPNAVYFHIQELLASAPFKAYLYAMEYGVEDVLNLGGATLDAPNMTYKHLSPRDMELFKYTE